MTADQEAAVRLALAIGSDAAARQFGLSHSQIATLRQKAQGEVWYRKIHTAALVLSKQIGPTLAANALGIVIGSVSRWRADAGLKGGSGVYNRDKLKPECVECGATMEEAGLCSDECRADYIEAEGRA